MQKIILIVTIDTECDKGKEWRTQYPFSFQGVYKGIQDQLQPLFNEFGIKPTFFLSPEILMDQQCVDILKGIKNCELGTHLHGEYIEPNADYFARETKTPQFEYSKEIEELKLFNLTELFIQKIGRFPTSFRAGRFGISPHTIKIIKDLGYRIDSSITPFRKVIFNNGNILNFWGAPIYPYYLSEKNFIIPGNSGVLEVPVSVSIPYLQKWPLSILRIAGRNSSIISILKKLNIEGKEVQLRPTKNNPNTLFSIAERIITYWPKGKIPILNIMSHNVEFFPNASPKTSTDNEVQSFIDCLYNLFNLLEGKYDVYKLGISEIPTLGF